ncbi:MAG: hypothetical protein ORO03_08635, partial [Alphaproteobacteria bacterium]|nr:hypothetical protein [Alphaproteobacteria bacterium]
VSPRSGQIYVFSTESYRVALMKKIGLLRRLTATAFALLRLWRGAKPRGDGRICEFSWKQPMT